MTTYSEVMQGGPVLGPINYRVTDADCSGDYFQSGFYSGYPAYLREDSVYWLTWSLVYSGWNICSTKGGANFGFSHWFSETIEGTYVPSGKVGNPIAIAFSNDPYTIFNIGISSGIELSGTANANIVNSINPSSGVALNGSAEVTTEEEEIDVIEGSGGCLVGGAEADVWRIVNCDPDTYRCFIKERDEYCVPATSFSAIPSSALKVVKGTPAIVAGIILCRMENQYAVSGEEYEQLISDNLRFDVFQISPQPTLQLNSLSPVPNISAMVALEEENKKLAKKKVLVKGGNNVEPTLSKEIRITLAAQQRRHCNRCRH